LSPNLRDEHNPRWSLFEVRGARRIFGAKKYEIIVCMRKLHEQKVHNLYCSPNIVRTIKSRRMRWAGHVAY
jgi:hypothetical protein